MRFQELSYLVRSVRFRSYHGNFHNIFLCLHKEFCSPPEIKLLSLKMVTLTPANAEKDLLKKNYKNSLGNSACVEREATRDRLRITHKVISAVAQLRKGWHWHQCLMLCALKLLQARAHNSISLECSVSVHQLAQMTIVLRALKSASNFATHSGHTELPFNFPNEIHCLDDPCKHYSFGFACDSIVLEQPLASLLLGSLCRWSVYKGKNFLLESLLFCIKN